MKLNVITESTKEYPEYITMKRIIEEKRLLKTKIKLLQIECFEKDIMSLQEKGLYLTGLGLDRFHFTNTYNMYVPITIDDLTTENNIDTEIKYYLIYLSYLYNVDFLKLYFENPYYLYDLLLTLHIDKKIKENLFFVLNKIPADRFSKYIDNLNNEEFRNALYEDQVRLKKVLSVNH